MRVNLLNACCINGNSPRFNRFEVERIVETRKRRVFHDSLTLLSFYDHPQL
jgi:hypothetical protein